MPDDELIYATVTAQIKNLKQLPDTTAALQALQDEFVHLEDRSRCKVFDCGSGIILNAYLEWNQYIQLSYFLADYPLESPF